MKMKKSLIFLKSPTFIAPVNNELPHQLLTIIEELSLIYEIGKAQLESNCLSGSYVIKLAQKKNALFHLTTNLVFLCEIDL